MSIREQIKPLLPFGVFVAQDVIRLVPELDPDHVEAAVAAMARDRDVIEPVGRFRYCRIGKKNGYVRGNNPAAPKRQSTLLELQLRNTVATLRELQETAKQQERETIAQDATFALKRLETWV